MNFQGKAVLVYLEEDNIARAYFRIQPLMTQDGPVGDTKAEYPDDGFLRIVPDKNEQHTFKERMRGMCGLCIMDLRHLPAEANKIRTNKNYAPIRGETNQYIIYSDAVRAMPEDLFFQVVAEGGVSTASTPQVYIRNGANIQGPFLRENGQPVGDPTPLPPDSAEIHSVTVNGQELLFYWPKVELPAPQPAQEEHPAAPAQIAESAPAEEEKAPEKDPRQNAYEQIQAMNVAPSATANRLHDAPSVSPIDFVPEQPAKPLTGTRLYQAPQRPASPRRAHNQLMEAVESQRYAARYEAPGATLPQSAELKEVHNPADALKRALAGMWQSPESQSQAVSVVLAQPGMRALISKAVTSDANDLTVAAMQHQLQDLEAERLMTLMQLDDVKKNLSAAREEAVGKLNMAEQKKLDELHIAQQNTQNALDAAEKSIADIEAKREEAGRQLAELQSAFDGNVAFLCPPVGQEASKQELIDRVDQALKAAGFLVETGDAQAMLTALALTAGTREIQFRADTEPDAQSLMEALAAALGTAAYTDLPAGARPVVLPGGSAPVFLASLAGSPAVRHPLVLLASLGVVADACKEEGWFTPHADLIACADPTAYPRPLPQYPPVSFRCIEKEMLKDGALSDETLQAVGAIRKALAEAGCPLPLATAGMLCRFIAATQDDLGVAQAMDRAMAIYVAAHVLDCGMDAESLKPLLAAMPRTLKALKL
ncbi:MAG: hypothetical protein IJ662_07265 [Clostridia bacterium]|nr:hypothetical protein [Clostridia bacterium]